MAIIEDVTLLITNLVSTVKVLVGGVFGLYLIVLFLKWREYQVLKATIQGMRGDIRYIAKKQGIKFENVISAEKPSIIKRIKNKIKRSKNQKITNQNIKKLKSRVRKNE